MADEKKEQGHKLDFDCVIKDDGKEFAENVILPEGDYTFYVEKAERDSFNGSDKIPACNKISLVLRVQTEDGGIAKTWTDLILYSTLEWKLSSFFRSIGQKKRGEELKMNFDTIQDSWGRAHFKPVEYINKNGDTRSKNDVAYYIDWDPKFEAEATGFTELPSDENAEDLPF